MLQMTGASRWSGWRSKTSSCRNSSRGPWPPRRRPAARPEPRWALTDLPLRSGPVATPTTSASKLCSLPTQGDRSRGRDESLAGAEGGVSGDRRVSVGPAAALPPDPQHHRCWEELHHHFPAAAWHDKRPHKALRRDCHTPLHKHSYTHTHTEATCQVLQTFKE